MIAAIVDAAGPFLPAISFCGAVQWWKWCRIPGKGVKPVPKPGKAAVRSIAKIVGL